MDVWIVMLNSMEGTFYIATFDSESKATDYIKSHDGDMFYIPDKIG